MASRSHVDVNERRLRPIYDCLDNGNNKKAIQEADKVLKKQRDLQCAKVLKALALLRLGRQDESAVLLEEIHAQHPTDEATLQAMSICYREVYKLESIADLYENAHKNRADNEDILSALFMAYVRLGNYKKQQQTAMKLHKLQPQKNPYYFWAIMSIVMQAHSCQEPKLARQMFLPLAERMTRKYIEEDKISAEAEVQLFLIILELLENWEESLKVVEGSLGEKLTSELHFRTTKAAELYTKLEKWPQVNIKYKQLLDQNPDQWNYWQHYISSCLKLADSNWTPTKDSSEADADYTEEMAFSFIVEKLKQSDEGRPVRGPNLAKLELCKQLKSRNRFKPELTGTPLHLMQQYYSLFCDKFCCFDDLKSFLDLLSDEEQSKFSAMMAETTNLPKDSEDSIGFAEDRKQMQRHITQHMIARNLGLHHQQSDAQRLDLSRDFIQRYQHGLQFGTELLSTDLQFSDNYLLLAAYLLLDMWRESGNGVLVWQAIVQLERGIRNSPSNHQIKMVLMKLYNMMGAYGPAHTLFESMEVKHVMNDTLGYLVANHVARLGHFVAACATYGTMIRFFTVNHKEMAEYLIASYKYGSFSKIHEFVSFRERLQSSLQYACAMTESMLLDLVLETASHQSTEKMVAYMEIDPEKEKTNFEELCDNRDFSVTAAWEPYRKCRLKEAQEHSFREEITWLKIRKLSLRTLSACVILGQQHVKSESHVNNGLNHNKKPTEEVVSDLLEQLSQLIDDSQEFSTPYDYPLHGPFRTHLCQYLKDRHCDAFCDMIRNVLYLQYLHENGFENTDNEKEETLKSLVPDSLCKLVSEYKCDLIEENDGRKCLNTSVLENLVFTAETLSHVTILAGVCHRILKPLKSSWNKKSKKKKGAAPVPQPCTFSNFTCMVEGLEKAASNLHKSVLDIDPVFLTLDLSQLNLSDSLCDTEEEREIEKEVWMKVAKSYQVSAREVTDFLHNKMQYLGSLRL